MSDKTDFPITKNVSRVTRLTCRHGHYLRVTADRVEGIKDPNDEYISLEMWSVRAGEVMLKGKASGKYIAMSSTGSLYTTDEYSRECIFREIFESKYNSYESTEYPSWYLALTKGGQAKFGPKTAPGQRAVGFLTK